MYCKKCGNEINENLTFCNFCGEKIVKSQTISMYGRQMQNEQIMQYENEQIMQYEMEQSRKRRMRMFVLIGILITAFVVAGILVGTMVIIPSLQQRMEEQAETDESESEDDDESESDEAQSAEDGDEEESAGNDNEADPEEAESAENNGEANTDEMETDVEGTERGEFSQSELAVSVRRMNTQENALPSIEVDAENYQPAARNYDAAWDNSLFYTLEDVSAENDADGKINNYDIQKKELVNKENGNAIEYNIYSNPANGVVNKIVSIEQNQQRLFINEYYYTDDGKINFIFEYEDTNYFPSYATPNRDGNRYYFDNDVMAKWRVVTGGSQTNYVIGAKSEEAGGNLGEVTQYADMDAALQGEYDRLEKAKINAAYNTYQIVLNSEGINVIQGYVYDANGNGAAQVTVDIRQAGDELSLYQAVTESDGSYNIYVPSQENSYQLQFHRENCQEITLYNVETSQQSTGNYQPAVYMIEGNNEYAMSIKLCDALNFDSGGQGMLPLANAAYHIRQGINAFQGDIIQSGESDAGGNINTTLAVGMYTIQILKEGYDDAWFTIIVRKEETVQYNVSPTLNAGEIRIVLSWSDTPRDLDSHLFTPYCTVGEHISYYHKADASGNSLDVDVISGYGPETVTITNLDTQGLYKYYVADYTNCSNGAFQSVEMSLSEAVVNVYNQSGLVETFYVPVSRPGVIWEVFEIRNGVIVPAQRYYQAVEDKDWWSNK